MRSFSGTGTSSRARVVIATIAGRSAALRGPIDLLWDRGPIHRRREVLDFIVTHPRLDVHYFPAYAPELNPAEYVWAQADHELANGAADDLRELRRRLTDATRRLRRSPDLLGPCIYASDLPWARWELTHRGVPVDPSTRPR